MFSCVWMWNCADFVNIHDSMYLLLFSPLFLYSEKLHARGSRTWRHGTSAQYHQQFLKICEIHEEKFQKNCEDTKQHQPVLNKAVCKEKRKTSFTHLHGQHFQDTRLINKRWGSSFTILILPYMLSHGVCSNYTLSHCFHEVG